MNVKGQLSDALNLPRDLTLGAVILTITGNCEAYVENYMSLIEYTEKLIRIQTLTCNEEMKIAGEIQEVKYC